MGGRGSGGGKSGSGGGASIKNNEVRLRSINDIYKEKYSQMTDLELNRAYANAQIQMKKEQAVVMHEQEKLAKMVEEFKAMANDDPRLDAKWDAIDKQTTILNDARSRSDIRSQAFLLAVNEKYNIRAKYNSKDMKHMTNGQLNSFYNNSYKESAKARRKIENTSNPKTKAKYQKIYDAHNENFKRASAEMAKRGLGGKDW